MRIALKTALKLQPLLLLRGVGREPRPRPPIKLIHQAVQFPTIWSPSKTLVPIKPFPFIVCRAMTTTSPPPSHVKDKIELSDTEKKIFDRLLGTLRHFGLQLQLRVAGGWVRDKLLGKDCYDIDIALDNMMGSEFVDKVREYMLSIGEEVQGVAVIPRNPEQSKHLETARMRLFSIWVDFVNLRCEEYSDNSRIPKQKYGTAEEDALRRDLTINSLFYNINTDSVEDFTGRGITDLKSGIIATPLPPKATFMDDPLRVLRAIRFGARFEFTIVEELKAAAACDDVKAALEAKISRERIGSEIDLMISGNQPVKALAYICDLELFWTVFSVPCESEPAITDGCDRLCLNCLENGWNLIQSIGWSTFSDRERRICLYSALFLPLRKTTYSDKKSKKVPVVGYIIRDSLKQKASDVKEVTDVYRASDKFLPLIPSLASNGDAELAVDWGKELVDIPISSRLRVYTGFLLREIKDLWRVALLISTLLNSVDTNDSEDMHFNLVKCRDLFQTVEDSIIKLGLDKVWGMEQLIDGRDVMNVLLLKSGGPLVKEWLEKALAWQLGHPSATKEECVDWLKQTHSKRARME